MAVDLVRVQGNYTLGGTSTWETYDQIPTSQVPNDSYFMTDVFIFGGTGYFVNEIAVVARYQYFYFKNSSGAISLIDSRIVCEFGAQSGGATAFEYRQEISSGNITIEGRYLTDTTMLYYDGRLRSR
jgi:hypothetical protein